MQNPKYIYEIWNAYKRTEVMKVGSMLESAKKAILKIAKTRKYFSISASNHTTYTQLHFLLSVF